MYDPTPNPESRHNGKTKDSLSDRASQWLKEAEETRLKPATDRHKMAEVFLLFLKAMELIVEFLAWSHAYKKEHALLTKKVLRMRDACTPDKQRTHWTPAHEIMADHRKEFRAALTDLVEHVTPKE